LGSERIVNDLLVISEIESHSLIRSLERVPMIIETYAPLEELESLSLEFGTCKPVEVLLLPLSSCADHAIDDCWLVLFLRGQTIRESM